MTEIIKDARYIVRSNANAHAFEIGEVVTANEDEGTSLLHGAYFHSEGGGVWCMTADEIDGPVDSVLTLIDGWRTAADEVEDVLPEHDDFVADDTETAASRASLETLRECATSLEIALGIVDTASSGSRQGYIETGRYTRIGEVI